MRTLPEPFAGWFAARGWRPRPHQMEMLAAAEAGESALLIAPTGGGKTLAGFLPSLIQLHRDPRPGLHTLYVSPLKALAVDIARNLTIPAEEMGLDLRIETRTGDTPANRRARQRQDPPQILLTTPESLTLLLSLPDAGEIFGNLACVVIDEIHALAGTKRGDQLALCLSRLSTLAPGLRRVGLSATVAHPKALAAWCARDADPDKVRLVRAAGGAAPEIGTILPAGRLPWGGHMGLSTMPEVYERLREAGVSIVFTNTRAQSELCFQALWRLNEDNLPIALHHGSLTVEQRRKVEAAMAAGKLRAVVATASLDLGIDWGAVDQVIQVGAPKGVARLLQRVGRANHRMDEPSRAALVPANRFEVIECRAAIEAVAEGEVDGDPPRPGGLDVLAQHILAMACHAPFFPDDLYAEVKGAAAYATLSRRDFDDTLRFVEDGGYALSGYERFRRLFRDYEGRVHVRGPQVARQLRMNLGTIVETPLLKVRMRGGPILGEVEEWFVSTLEPGDNFIFAGQVLRYERLDPMAVIVSRGGEGEPRVPAYAGSKLPLSTSLALRVREILSNPRHWKALPEPVREWLAMQRKRSELPPLEGLLVEVFPRGNRWFLVAYCFEGRLAHQTLGMLVTRRMEHMGLGPLGFLGTDYVMAVWSAFEPTDVEHLFEEDLLGEELEEWIAESSMLRRTFRNIATIAGLLEKNHPGQEKSGRQMSMSADLIYDVLRKHEPDHILLRATRAEAAFGLTDVARIGSLLERARGRIRVRRLNRVSPLAVPALIEEGREWVSGSAEDALLAEAVALVEEATGGEDSFTGDLTDGTPEASAPKEHPPRQSRSMRLARRRPRR
ncbi:ligase-associated DNA damage response DEXH box helicase [Pseudoroseomonas wenyumeiae]|uniref:Ligase-associated DNA damage response DEXH box helicase n=1 Tax=Teichococcus wenyumeiae TaxID=2478470 RepID=A0A3A9JWX7_9PROT|nr:ligase-associated DNA damage response DEXH box helicase [Pseudoroseomonas wenyumeiae]RKK03559.1 ligase-associated DNA damage response DEXH box helicase [Pseudoroseomonas wenyumeiae]RMI25739.1 ligase-associated DNA damage response DEXH box helicase [Pseudoroseomonas wenyumeiae]